MKGRHFSTTFLSLFSLTLSLFFFFFFKSRSSIGFLPNYKLSRQPNIFIEGLRMKKMRVAFFRVGRQGLRELSKKKFGSVSSLRHSSVTSIRCRKDLFIFFKLFSCFFVFTITRLKLLFLSPSPFFTQEEDTCVRNIIHVIRVS